MKSNNINDRGARVFGWLKRLFGGGTAFDDRGRNPALRAAVQKSAEAFEQTPLRELITETEREKLARELFLEINRICNAGINSLACRESLAETMLRFSRYQVLVIPPAPEKDPSGLRGQPGISGELKSHIVELAKRAEHLRTDLFGMEDELNFDNVWREIQALYWKEYWRLESINAARIEIGDHNTDRDWYRPFMHAACATAEHIYRYELEMPPAFEAEVAKPISTAYSIYTDIVVSGASDPDVEWRDYFKDSEIPVPHFNQHV